MEGLTACDLERSFFHDMTSMKEGQPQHNISLTVQFLMLFYSYANLPASGCFQ